MQKLFFDHALIGDGWADNVTITHEAGTITAVERDSTRGDAAYGGSIALPGLPNLHSHTFQRGMAGLAETRGPSGDSFWTWRQVMYGFLGALTPEDVEAIAAYAFLEMLEGGFTAVAEFHYLHHAIGGVPYANLAEHCERIAAAAEATGIGLTLLPVFYAQGGFGGQPAGEGQRRFLNDPDRFAALLEGARKAVARLPDARIGIAPHSLRAVTPESLAAVLPLAGDAPIHIHVAEQTKEVEDCLAWCGRRPVEWLLDNAPVDGRWCLIHATHLTDAEVAGIAGSGAVAGLCPITEANLGDGIFAGVDFVRHGGVYGVGSDSNIEITAPGELRQLEYSQRLALRGRNLMARHQGESTARRLYDEACRGGARALGRAVGALAPRHRADIVVLDGAHVDLAPMRGDRWLDAYLFVAGKAVLDRVYVGGRQVVSGGRHEARETVEAAYRRTLARLVTT